MNDVAGWVQFFISAVTFALLVGAFFVNVSYLEEKRTWLRKFKVLGVAISFLMFAIFYKELFKYALIFIFIGLLSTEKKKANDKTTGILDNRELG